MSQSTFIFRIFLGSFILWFAVILFKENSLENSGYLLNFNRAKQAATLEDATKELNKTIKGMEYEQVTEGYTSLFRESINYDVGLFYKTLKTWQSRLDSVSADKLMPQNVKQETLSQFQVNMKVITVPGSLSIAFNYGWYIVWFWVSILGMGYFYYRSLFQR